MRQILFSFLLLMGGNSVYAQQFPNGTFETFESGWNEVGEQPTSWKASNVKQNAFITTVKVQEVYSADGRNNGKSVRMCNTWAGFGSIGSNAPAYITLGSPWVYANTSNPDASDGGTWGGVQFTNKPDAIRGYIKRIIADTPNDHGTLNQNEVCNILFYSWKGSTKTVIPNITSSADGISGKNKSIDNLDRAVLGISEPDEKSADFALVAKGQYNVPANTTDWQEIIIPIEYFDDEAPEMMNIIISAADYFNRPNIGDNNELWADDFEFVYNSELKSLTYDGESIPVKTEMDLSNKKYDIEKLKYTLTGVGATLAEPSYDNKTGVLTLVVKGNDWTVDNQNQHTYKIQFAPDPKDVSGDYTRLVKVPIFEQTFSSVNDINISESSETSVGVDFLMKDFSFMGVSMGNVEVKGAQLSFGENGSIDIKSDWQSITLHPDAPEATDINANVKLTAKVTSEKELTAEVEIQWDEMSFVVQVGAIPFNTTLEGKTLKVTGSVAADEAAAVIPADADVNVVDLTETTLTGDDITAETFGAKNPNTLFYAVEGAPLTGNNVVKGTECDNFVLTDGQSFNAPEGFTANQITYKRATAASTDEKDEVYTFVLPFTFTADKVNGTVYELTGVNDGVLDFTSLEGSMELKANRPYLVVSNGTQLLNASAFSGEVVATGDLTNEVYGGVTMVGAYEATPITSGASESWYGYNANGQFVKANTGTINPFRTAIKSTGSQSSFALKLDGTVTGIVNLENPNAKVDVYTISGVCVRKNVPAASALNGLSRGVYIVGGQKVVK